MLQNNIELGQQTFKVLFQWGYPDFDGGTPITHYSIEIDNGIQQNTSQTSYEAEFIYNTTVNVSVTAHNCVGCSDSFVVQIFHDGMFIVHIVDLVYLIPCVIIL